MNTIALLLTNLTGRGRFDIIRPSCSTDRNIILSYLDTNNIGYTVITESDAAKLLATDECKGIGIGCYVPNIADAYDHSYRKIESHLRYIDLSNIVGMITVEPAYALPFVPIPKRRILSIAA